MKSACGKLSRAVKSQDLFGVPVQLTYRGARSFSSVIGGCLSILMVLVFAVAFILMFHQIYTEPQWKSTPETYNFGNELFTLRPQQATLAIQISAKKNLFNPVLPNGD